MPISVLCPKCRKKLSAPDAMAGKRAKCPHCGQLMQLPAPRQPDQAGQTSAAPPGAAPPPSGPGGNLPGLSEELPDLTSPTDIYGIQSPFSGVNSQQFDEMLADTGPKIDRPASEPNRYPCPACGEMIVRGAAKCRYCGEVFDPVLKQKQKKKKKRSSSGDADDELGALDWVLAILCGNIACILGIVWMIQGKPKGIKMIGAALAATAGWWVVGFILGMLGEMQ
ncbi:MAG TPA: hypothetical protein DD670_18795 [Planctomycetaceae bacterium]|nr:hypothetical protein [Planctomycetaceae bacterium]